jgi:hypothetical protein
VAWANDVPLETVGHRCEPLGSDGVWTKPGAEGGSVLSGRGRVRRLGPPEPGSDRPVPMAPPRVTLLAAAGDATLEGHRTHWGEMLTRFRTLLRRVRASQRRRAQLSGDPLLPPDAERARARATLDYYNRVGDPASC